jgi:hypothetical protein
MVVVSAFQHYVRSTIGAYLDIEDSRNANQNILRRLVRTHVMHYWCELFVGIRQSEWQAGVAVAISSWTVSLTRVNTLFPALEAILAHLCTSHQPYYTKVRDNHVSTIYCGCYCSTDIPMYLVSPLSHLLPTYANYTSESQSNARNSTYSTTTMQPSVLPLLDTL